MNQTGIVSDDPWVPLLVSSPGLAYPYLIIAATALVLGVIGNFLTLASFVISKTLRSLGNEFLLNLAIADLCVTGIADPLCILGIIQGKDFFKERPILCEFVAAFCLTACFCAFFCLTGLTMHRYMYLCHPDLYHRIFKRRWVILMCVGAWVAAFAFEMPNFMGWGGHLFDEKNMSCIWDRKASVSYSLFVVVLVGGPLLFMSVAYFRIMLKIRDSKRRVMANTHTGGIQEAKSEWKKVVKSCKTLFVVLIAFLICWTPYTVVIAIDHEDRFPLGVHLYVTLLAHLHSSVTFIIYAKTSSNFRAAYKRLLLTGCGICWRRKDTWSDMAEEDTPKKQITPPKENETTNVELT